jgi:hypothetical protein
MEPANDDAASNFHTIGRSIEPTARASRPVYWLTHNARRRNAATALALWPLIATPHAYSIAWGGTVRFRRLLMRYAGAGLGLALLWLAASCYEWGTGQRVLPWDPYAACGDSVPATLPATVKIGLYEEFPSPWRLAQLRHIDFPVALAVAAPSRDAFLQLRATILHQYPQVHEVYFWPLLKSTEGYYPGTWSDAAAVRRVAGETAGLPVLWDLEMPPGLAHPSVTSWPQNRALIDQWLQTRTEPVHIWRSHASMGLDPLFLRLVGMHFDPLDYPQVSLHLDLYNTGAGRPANEMSRILRCGVERYGARFIPALGVLNDGAGAPGLFVPPETLQRDLKLARAAGVAELWLFGVNGMNADIVRMLHQTLPLEKVKNYEL